MAGRDSRGQMVRALGYSLDEFDPNDPGRLCRGRERWIDPIPLPSAAEIRSEGLADDPHAHPTRLHRMVCSGAAFSDETASDAQRGLRFSGLSAGEVISALFPGRTVIAVAEDAFPLTIPPEAVDVEHYALTRSQGPLRNWRARWRLVCPDAPTVEAAVEAGADVLLVLGTRPGRARAAPEPLPEGVDELLFLLVGFRQEGAPSRRFQPSALAPLLEQATAVVLVHQDKHAPSLGIYTRERLAPREAIDRLARARGALPVPFAIPPMLARWDRALWELRQSWDDRSFGEFPVPPAPESRGARRGRGRAHSEE